MRKASKIFLILFILFSVITPCGFLSGAGKGEYYVNQGHVESVTNPDKEEPLADLGQKDEEGVIFNLCVFGDNRPANDKLAQPQSFKNLVENMINYGPELYFNTGDIINGGTTNLDIINREFTDYLEVVEGLDCPGFVSCGNHDVANKTSARLFEEMVNAKSFAAALNSGTSVYFPAPDAALILHSPALKNAEFTRDQDLYYHFSYKSMYFIILYAYQEGSWGAIEGKQLEWLENILSRLKDEKVFVFVHPPVYSFLNPGCITDGSLHVAFSSRKNQDHIRNLFKEFKVDAVFSGHEHMYRMEQHDGTTYIISGCSGAFPYASEEEGGFLHFIEIKIKEDTWEMSVIDKNGNLFYSKELGFN